MAKKKIEIFEYVENNNHFEKILNQHDNNLMCAEVYNEFSGPCFALDRFFQRMKLDWSNGKMILLRVKADEIEILSRFREHSEPVFLFIMVTFFPSDLVVFRKKRVTQVIRGVNAIKFEDIAKKEIHYSELEVPVERTTYALDEATPEETQWMLSFKHDREHQKSSEHARRAARQAARKLHRAQRMVPYLENLNFVLFWPHCKHAHPELYERWDINDIIMVGREELQLSSQEAIDLLYAGDAPINEASILTLTSAPALVVCFRLLQENTHFVTLVRKILYEELPVLDEIKPVSEQPPRMTAYDSYKTVSKSKEKILKERRMQREQRKLEKQERRARRLSEMQRLAQQAVEDELQRRRQMREQKKLELLRTGQLDELKALNEMPEETNVSIEVAQELDEESDEESEEEDPSEYFPPAGLPVPGVYAPPNDEAKVNGLALMFPKLVHERVTPLPEFLPPHIIVMTATHKRHKVIDSMKKHKNSIIHMGIFRGSTPYDAEHVSFSVKQFDMMKIEDELDQYRIALMVSVERDTGLLTLMDWMPLYVSRDPDQGEVEAHELFPCNYSDDYNDLEDFA